MTNARWLVDMWNPATDERKTVPADGASFYGAMNIAREANPGWKALTAHPRSSWESAHDDR